MFPHISAEEASEALRKTSGDVEAARRDLQNQIKALHETPMPAQAVASEPVEMEQNIPGQCKEKVETTCKEAPKENSDGKEDNEEDTKLPPLQERRPPKNSVNVNNLSDRQYCCVWWVEVYQDGYRPDIARSLLARVARHINPILRDRGWRVKRLIESASPSFLGCCVTNGRDDADAASANIQLNLRQEPSKYCPQFRTFSQVLNVMLHEITHISIGLEDIHPPAFWELLDEIKQQYQEKLSNGEVATEKDDYGCKNMYISPDGKVSTIEESAASAVENLQDTKLSGTGEWCGAGKRKTGNGRRRNWNGKRRASTQAIGIKAAEQQQKRRPLKKGTKMVDKRTKEGKAKVAALKYVTPRELAARAALARLGGEALGGTSSTVAPSLLPACLPRAKEAPANDYDGESDDDIEVIEDHPQTCACRCCQWEKMLLM